MAITRSEHMSDIRKGIIVAHSSIYITFDNLYLPILIFPLCIII